MYSVERVVMEARNVASARVTGTSTVLDELSGTKTPRPSRRSGRSART